MPIRKEEIVRAWLRWAWSAQTSLGISPGRESSASEWVMGSKARGRMDPFSAIGGKLGRMGTIAWMAAGKACTTTGKCSRAASRTTRPRVPTEIDLIAARATHEEPERRYASAAALAEDIQRFLRGRPIHAAPDSVGYRISKFIRRHRLATAAMLAAILLAGAFTWRLARERGRPGREHDEVVSTYERNAGRDPCR